MASSAKKSVSKALSRCIAWMDHWFISATVSLIVACGVCFAVYYFESVRHQKMYEKQWSLTAGEWVDQIQRLMPFAPTQDKFEASAWAIEKLNERLSKRSYSAAHLFHLPFNKNSVKTTYSLDRKKGDFDYVAPLDSENGVRIRIETGYLGLWNTLSSKAEMLGICSLGFVIFFLLCLLMDRYPRWMVADRRKAKEFAKEELSVQLKDWFSRFQPLVIELGRCLREVLKDAKEMIRSSNEMSEKVFYLKAMIERDLASAKQIEKKIDVWKKEIDSICEAYEASSTHSEQLSHHVKETTEALAHHFEFLKK